VKFTESLSCVTGSTILLNTSSYLSQRAIRRVIGRGSRIRLIKLTRLIRRGLSRYRESLLLYRITLT
jgi:hypothetical protein